MLSLRVRSVTWEAQDILSFELVDPVGGTLPPVQAGAHLDVRVPGGLARRYSLCDPPWQRDHWRIAVLDAPNSRGGSRAMHQQVRAGQMLEVEGPHNFFPLAPVARHTVLLAGGIGITPVLAMAEQLQHDDRSWELHYCTRSPERTAFASRLSTFGERVHIHHDGGEPARALNVASLLREHRAGTHLYYCGPAGFMKAVQAAASHWPTDTVHFEWFGADPATDTVPTAGEGGRIVLQRSGRTIEVSPGRTVLQALREAGVECMSSCEAGMCSTCALRYFDGEPVHADLVLSEEERRHTLLACCAGIGPRPLVLDL